MGPKRRGRRELRSMAVETKEIAVVALRPACVFVCFQVANGRRAGAGTRYARTYLIGKLEQEVEEESRGRWSQHSATFVRYPAVCACLVANQSTRHSSSTLPARSVLLVLSFSLSLLLLPTSPLPFARQPATITIMCSCQIDIVRDGSRSAFGSISPSLFLKFTFNQRVSNRDERTRLSYLVIQTNNQYSGRNS